MLAACGCGAMASQSLENCIVISVIHHKYVNSMQFSRLWEAIAPQPQAASTKDAYPRVQIHEIFRLEPSSIQNFGVHFHRT